MRNLYICVLVAVSLAFCSCSNNSVDVQKTFFTAQIGDRIDVAMNNISTYTSETAYSIPQGGYSFGNIVFGGMQWESMMIEEDAGGYFSGVFFCSYGYLDYSKACADQQVLVAELSKKYPMSDTDLWKNHYFYADKSNFEVSTSIGRHDGVYLIELQYHNPYTPISNKVNSDL